MKELHYADGCFRLFAETKADVLALVVEAEKARADGYSVALCKTDQEQAADNWHDDEDTDQVWLEIHLRKRAPAEKRDRKSLRDPAEVAAESVPATNGAEQKEASSNG